MSRPQCVVPLLLVWIFSSTSASAAIRCSFDLDSCGWNASHIVVVSEGETIDGTVTVVESWKGNLPEGRVLKLPALAAFADEEKRAISPRWLKPGDNKPRHVTGSRIVVFLKWQPEGKDLSKGTWKEAARWGGFPVSVAWIEGTEAFAIRQVMNPGPCETVPLKLSEEKMRERVRYLNRVQADLQRALALDDKSKRAQTLGSLVDPDMYYVRIDALKALSECGKPALPVLRKMLKDNTLARHHGDIVRTLSKAGGKDAGRELTVLLEQELAFWKKRAPQLPRGWWNGGGLAWAEVEHLRNRYGVTLEAVRGIGAARYQKGQKAVATLRDYWRSLPQLEDKSGLNQMSQECDQVLTALEK